MIKTKYPYHTSGMDHLVYNAYVAYLKEGAFLRASQSQTFDSGIYNYNVEALYHYWHPRNRNGIVPIAEHVGHTITPFVSQKGTIYEWDKG